MKLTVNKFIELAGTDVNFFVWSKESNKYEKIFEWNDFLPPKIGSFAPPIIGNRTISVIGARNDGTLYAIIGEDTYEDTRKEYLETKVQKLEELLDEMEKILEIRKKI